MPTKTRKLYRCDVLPSPMNRGKHARVLALLQAWRRVAVLHGRGQWRTFYQCGVLDARLKTRTGYDHVCPRRLNFEPPGVRQKTWTRLCLCCEPKARPVFEGAE